MDGQDKRTHFRLLLPTESQHVRVAQDPQALK